MSFHVCLNNIYNNNIVIYNLCRIELLQLWTFCIKKPEQYYFDCGAQPYNPEARPITLLVLRLFLCHEWFWPENTISQCHCCLPTQPVNDIVCSDLIAAEMSKNLLLSNIARSRRCASWVITQTLCHRVFMFLIRPELHNSFQNLKVPFCFLWEFPLPCQPYVLFIVLLLRYATIIATEAFPHTEKSLKY